MDDFRVKTSWRNHRKRKQLRRRLGADAVLALEDLWSYAAHDRTNGRLDGMSAEDIADEVDYPGDARALIDELLSLRLLEGEEGSYSIHEWDEHQPYVANHEARSEAARNAANVRWGKRGHATKCEPHAKGMRTACDSYAPYPSPSPVDSTEIHSISHTGPRVRKLPTGGAL